MRYPEIIVSGKAMVSSIDVMYDTDDFYVTELDMDSKYIEPVVAFSSDEPPEVILMAFDRALNLANSDAQTILGLPPHTAGWEVMADGGRYTIRIVAWRPVDKPE